MWQPRVGVAWDVKGDGKSVVRASCGRLLRAPEHAEPGRIGHDQRPAAADASSPAPPTCCSFGAPTPAWPGVRDADAGAGRAVPALQRRARVRPATTRTRASMPSTSPTSSELMPDLAGYVDFIWNEGRNLTRFLNYNRSGPVVLRSGPGHRQHLRLQRHAVGAAARRGDGDQQPRQSRYRGLTLGIRKRLSRGYQLEANYVLAKDEDDDSNERDPFTDRSFNFFDLSKDWGPSDRDIRHKFNVFGYFAVPARRSGSTRACRTAARSRSRASPRSPQRRRSRPQQRAQGQRVLLVRLAPRRGRSGSAGATRSRRCSRCSTRSTTPTTSTRCSTPALFNFDGFLRTGVGDPRQVQLAVKLTF